MAILTTLKHRRTAFTAVCSAVGGVAAGAGLLLLHPRPLEVIPAAPVYLLCLLGGGGDLGAFLFILIGGFVLYGGYGLLLSLPSRPRHRLVLGACLLVMHLAAAWLCELKRMGRL